jgi:hypothetical protein
MFNNAETMYEVEYLSTKHHLKHFSSPHGPILQRGQKCVRDFYCGGVEFLRDLLGKRESSRFEIFLGVRLAVAPIPCCLYRAIGHKSKDFTRPMRPFWAPYNLRFFRPFIVIFGYFFSARRQELLCAIEGLGSPHLYYESFCPNRTPTLPSNASPSALVVLERACSGQYLIGSRSPALCCRHHSTG